MSNTSALVSRRSWAAWRSNKGNRTTWTAFTSKTLKRKCQNHPVRAAGAAVSPREAGLSRACVRWQWQVRLMRGRVSHVMHLDPMCCRWWRDNLASRKKQKNKRTHRAFLTLRRCTAKLKREHICLRQTLSSASLLSQQKSLSGEKPRTINEFWLNRRRQRWGRCKWDTPGLQDVAAWFMTILRVIRPP